MPKSPVKRPKLCPLQGLEEGVDWCVGSDCALWYKWTDESQECGLMVAIQQLVEIGHELPTIRRHLT